MKEERLYAKKGFTEKIMRILGEPSNPGDIVGKPFDIELMKKIGIQYYFDVPAPKILEVEHLIPKENLMDRQNGSPTIKEFIEVAKTTPKALFSCYIILKTRPDERFQIDGVSLPKPFKLERKRLLKKAKNDPDEDDEIEINAERYVTLWWD